MHIAYLTPEYPHPRLGNAGGMGTSIKNLATTIARYGHQVSIFVYGQECDEVFNEQGITFHVIEKRTYRLGGFYFYRKHIEKYVNDNCGDVEIIEAPDWTGITAFMNLRKPLIIRFHGSDTYFCHIEGRKQKWKNAFFEKLAVTKAKAFIAPTTFAGEKSMALFGLSITKLSVIHYGLALENFQNLNPENYQKLRILNIGTLIRKKGVLKLAQIFNKLVDDFPTATLVLVGADSHDIQTGTHSTWELVQEQLSERAKGQTSYLGKIPYDLVQDEIKKAHVCVFPSLAETLGMVTIESMALQKAVVNTNIGWAQDLIEHGVDGFMHHPDDIDDYVSTLKRLFTNDELVQEIGLQARKTVEERFDILKICDQNITFYKSVLTS